MFNEVRLALRHLSRAPSFSISAAAILALATGSTGAVVLLLNALVLRPVQVPQPKRLTLITISNEHGLQGFVSLPAFDDLRRAQDVFDGLCGTTGITTARLEVGGAIVSTSRESVTGECATVLGVRPFRGRLIGQHEFSTAEPVVVVSYRLWQQQLSADPAVIGRVIRVEGVPLTIIGVTPATFSSIGIEQSPDLTLPLSIMGRLLGTPAALRAYYLVGRLRPGINPKAGQARIAGLWPAILKASESGPDMLARQYMRGMDAIRVESGEHGISPLRKRYVKPLVILLSLGLTAWLIAALNVGGLLLARTINREGELLVHVAVGATSGQISQMLLFEGVLLSLLGGLLGLPLMIWFASSLSTFVWTGALPLTLRLAPDAMVFVAVLVGLLLSGAIISLPATLFWSLHSVRRTGASSRSVIGGVSLAGKLLTIAQLALSLALLSSAGLFVQHVIHLRSIDPGYRSAGLFFTRPAPVPGPMPWIDLAEYQRQLLERLSRLAGISGVALSSQFPMATTDGLALVPVQATDTYETGGKTSALHEVVSPGFFETVGVGLLGGRGFTWDDDAAHPPVAIINEALAEQIFGSAQPIGRRLHAGTDPTSKSLEVVGVVRNASPGDVRISRLPIVYRPIVQEPAFLRNPVITVRAADRGGLGEAIRQAVASFGYNYVTSVRTVDDQIERTLLPERTLSVLSLFVGAFSILLAVLGLYALLSYSLSRRLREMALRLALGATGHMLTLLILREAILIATTGILLGAPLTWAAVKLSHSLLSELSESSMGVFCGASVIMLIGALLAIAGPAFGAGRTEPATALRLD